MLVPTDNAKTRQGQLREPQCHATGVGTCKTQQQVGEGSAKSPLKGSLVLCRPRARTVASLLRHRAGRPQRKRDPLRDHGVTAAILLKLILVVMEAGASGRGFRAYRARRR